jgi:hypothetical protein
MRGKAFTYKESLRQHERKHTGELPYKCEEDGCGKAFRSMARHRVSHVDDRLFECGYRDAIMRVPCRGT